MGLGGFSLPTLSDIKDAISGALAPFFPADDPPSDLTPELALPDADTELSELLLAMVGGKPEPRMVIGRLKGQTGTTVQTLIFPKADFPTTDACMAWLKRNNLSAGKVDETSDSWRYRQRDPGDFEPNSFRTITPGQKQATEPDLTLAESPHTQDFLAEFRRRVLAMAKDGPLTDEQLMECMKSARGHAGGMTAAKNRQAAALSEVALSEFAWGVELGEVGKPIQIMRVGEFDHPEYGKFAITPQTLAEIVKTFNAGVRGQDLPIDVDHNHEGGAVGWMKSLAVKGDTLWATPEWTEEGARDVAAGKYRYFSPHFGPWKNPETGDQYPAVLMSGAVTNFPFLKNMAPISLSEFATRKEAAVSANVEDLEKQLTEARETAAKAEADATERERLLTEAQERVAAAEARDKELTERVARMEHDGMVKRLTEQVRGNGNPNARLIGDEDQLVTHLVKLAETFGEESDEVQFVLQREQAHSTALREAGAFTEIGSSQGGTSGVEQEFEQAVTKAMSEHGLDRGKATAKVLSENRDLYTRYNRQTVANQKD